MTISSIRLVAIIILLVGASIATYVTVVYQAKDIAYHFAPEYTPMSREEIEKQYPRYYASGEGYTAFDRMQHESSKKIVDFEKSGHLRKFEEQNVNENTELIIIAATIVFGIAWLFAAALTLRVLYRERSAISGGIKKLLYKLPLRGVISHGKVKLAEIEYSKIKRLQESGLITKEEYEKRKGKLVASVHANLR